MKLSEKVKDVISAVAPTVGLALGGPLGGLAGNVLAAMLGTNDPEKIEDLIARQSPEALLALKKAEQDFLLKMKELGIQEEQLFVNDRTSARELAKVDMRPHVWLTALFLAGYFGLLYLFIAGEINVPPEYKDFSLALIGVITASVPQLMSFWFGSSHGSMQKTELLGKGGM